MLPLEEVGQDADIKLTTDGNDKEDEEDDTLSSCSCPNSATLFWFFLFII